MKLLAMIIVAPLVLTGCSGKKKSCDALLERIGVVVEIPGKHPRDPVRFDRAAEQAMAREMRVEAARIDALPIKDRELRGARDSYVSELGGDAAVYEERARQPLNRLGMPALSAPHDGGLGRAASEIYRICGQ